MSDFGVLYVVATPIGNLGDMTPRAIDTLKSVDIIAAEDTRHSNKLLQHFGIDTTVISYHEHNERPCTDTLIAHLQQGKNVALISDAGTPLISDPGFCLVRQARLASIRVIPIPGASALIAALSASGLPPSRFLFEGFLPAKQQARREKLSELNQQNATVIFYESPHRIIECISDMCAVLGGERYVVLARELTKTFEFIHGAPLSELSPWLLVDTNRQRGEFVILVQGVDTVNKQIVNQDAVRVLDILLEDLSVKQAASLASKITGVNKNVLYEQALQKTNKKS